MSDSTSPVRIQRQRTKGWRKPENTIYVGRPTRWANPFRVGKPVPSVWLHIEFDHDDTMKYLGSALVADAAEAVRLYRKYALPSEANIGHLRGKSLACWCKLGAPCHADVLLEVANR